MSIKHNETSNVKQELEKPLSYFLPEGHSIWKEKMPSWANEVTLHQLLVHTSGIPDYTEDEAFQRPIDLTDKRFYENPHSSGSIISLIKEQGLSFRPGSKHSYSNSNYLLLAEVVSAISGKTYAEFLTEQFFIPLDMKETFNPIEGNIKDLQSQERLAHLADALNFDPDIEPPFSSLATHIDMSNAQGAGSIISSAEDLLKWNVALHVDRKVLPDDLYTLMITDQIAGLGEEDGEGYGLGVVNTPQGYIYGYQGRIDSYNVLLLYSPIHETTFIALSNTDTGYGLLWNAIETALEEQQNPL